MEAQDTRREEGDEGPRPGTISGAGGEAATASHDTTGATMDTSLSNSYPLGSPELLRNKNVKSSVSIDWLELAGCVLWSSFDSLEPFNRIFEIQNDARKSGVNEIYNVAGYACWLRPTGLGSGRTARQTYALETPFGLIAFSPRDEANRQLPNFYLKVTGEKCLLVGAHACREFAHRVIKEFYGTFSDEWVRRIDLALDLPGVNIRRAFVPSFRHQHFVTSAKQASEFQSDLKRTGFKIGAKTSVAMIGYDKLEETLTKGPEYVQGMRQRRWGGTIPECATRIELQISGSWLSQYGDRKADDVLNNLGAIVEKLIGEDRPWFRFTKAKPDRENKHQSRAEILPAWKKAVRKFIRGAGKPATKLKRVKPFRRIDTNDVRGYQMIQSILGRSAARRGHPVFDFEDAVEELRDLRQMNPDLDKRWQEKWMTNAIDAGTYTKPTETPF